MTQKASSTFLQLPMAPYESIKETEKRSNSNKYTTKNNYISDYTTQNSNSITFRDKPVIDKSRFENNRRIRSLRQKIDEKYVKLDKKIDTAAKLNLILKPLKATQVVNKVIESISNDTGAQSEHNSCEYSSQNPISLSINDKIGYFETPKKSLCGISIEYSSNYENKQNEVRTKRKIKEKDSFLSKTICIKSIKRNKRSDDDYLSYNKIVKYPKPMSISSKLKEIPKIKKNLQTIQLNKLQAKEKRGEFQEIDSKRHYDCSVNKDIQFVMD